MKKFLNSEKGFTTQDTALAMIFIVTFVGVISITFANAFKLAIDIKENAIATNYFINCVENIKMSDSLSEQKVNDIIAAIDLKEGYSFDYEIIEPEYGQAENLYENLKLILNYTSGDDTKKLETNIQICNKGKLLDVYEKVHGEYQVY